MLYNYATKFLVINKNIFFSQRRKGTKNSELRTKNFEL